MLIYDHALDPYHCAIRILALCLFSNHPVGESLELDRARILDYFLVYPSKLAAVRLPQEYKSIRTVAKEVLNPYRHSPGKRAAFERMRPIFYAAVSGLAAAGYLELPNFEQGILRCAPENLPPEVAAAVDRFIARQSAAGDFVISALAAIPLNGPDGLKHRTGLLEYRYDIV